MTKEQYQKAVTMVRSYERSSAVSSLLKSHVFYAYLHVFKEEPNFDVNQFAKDCEF
jgi:hypothetical protein